MATLTIRLEVDPQTQKKNVWVKLDSDADALPHEHEEQHRRIVDALLAGGAVKPEELGTITIEREAQRAAEPAVASEEAAPRLPVGHKA